MGGDLGVWVDEVINSYECLKKLDSSNSLLKFMEPELGKDKSYLWAKEHNEEFEFLCPSVNRGRSEEALGWFYSTGAYSMLMRIEKMAYWLLHEEMISSYKVLSKISPKNELLNYMKIDEEKIIRYNKEETIEKIKILDENDFKLKFQPPLEWILSEKTDKEIDKHYSFLDEGWKEVKYGSGNTCQERKTLEQLKLAVNTRLMNSLYVSIMKGMRKDLTLKIYDELLKISNDNIILNSLKMQDNWLALNENKAENELNDSYILPKKEDERIKELFRNQRPDNNEPYPSRAAEKEFKKNYPAISNYLTWDSFGVKFGIPVALIYRCYLVEKEKNTWFSNMEKEFAGQGMNINSVIQNFKSYNNLINRKGLYLGSSFKKLETSKDLEKEIIALKDIPELSLTLFYERQEDDIYNKITNELASKKELDKLLRAKNLIVTHSSYYGENYSYWNINKQYMNVGDEITKSLPAKITDLSKITKIIDDAEKKYETLKFMEWGCNWGVQIKEKRINDWRNSFAPMKNEFFSTNPKASIKSSEMGMLMNLAEYANSIKKTIQSIAIKK
ncbi:MAG: hypothetical protein PHN56_02350 [Candidatus Nanoarchaeia archaeon]|nr:hypothetical protein [Candidatus Nanoarchaeia archaeon]